MLPTVCRSVKVYTALEQFDGIGYYTIINNLETFIIMIIIEMKISVYLSNKVSEQESRCSYLSDDIDKTIFCYAVFNYLENVLKLECFHYML